jgi:phospholipase/lecithinase/hemolysin
MPWCSAEAAPAFAFWDQSHPSNTIHAQIAGIARAEIAPIPLPATGLLLVVAVGAVAGLSRRAA